MGIPLIKKFDENISLPVIYFYNKTTMNTFMTRKLEQELVNLNVPQFLDNIKGLMKNLGKYNKLTKKPEEFQPEREKVIELLKNIKSYMVLIEDALVTFQSKSTKSIEKNLVSSYLSNMFGKISKEKHGQETVFHWIDLCLNNGLSNLFKDYQRIYKPWLPPGAEIFL